MIKNFRIFKIKYMIILFGMKKNIWSRFFFFNNLKYLDWHSYDHKNQKESVINSLAFRAVRICDEEKLPSELNNIKE